MASGFSKVAHLGDTVLFDLAITRDGLPVDLTGATLWFTAKRSPADVDADAVFQKSTGSGISVSDAAGGLARVTVAPTDTSTLSNTDQTLECDVQLKEADGTVTTVARGQLILIPQITRAT